MSTFHPGAIAARTPDRLAAAFGGISMTYGALREPSRTCAARRRAADLGRLDTMALPGGEARRVRAAAWAPKRSGRCCLPAPATLRAPEPARLPTDSGATGIVVGPALAPLADAPVALATNAARRLTHSQWVRTVLSRLPALPFLERARHGLSWQTSVESGHVDPDGHLFLTDRAVFAIIPDRFNIDPAEAEAALLALTELVSDRGVFELPDADLGEPARTQVGALQGILAHSGLAGAIFHAVALTLAVDKPPRPIALVADVGRTETGKRFKPALKADWPNRRERGLSRPALRAA